MKVKYVKLWIKRGRDTKWLIRYRKRAIYRKIVPTNDPKTLFKVKVVYNASGYKSTPLNESNWDTASNIKKMLSIFIEQSLLNTI